MRGMVEAKKSEMVSRLMGINCEGEKQQLLVCWSEDKRKARPSFAENTLVNSALLGNWQQLATISLNCYYTI